MNLAQMLVLMISSSNSKLRHLGSKARSPGQNEEKLCLNTRGHIFEVIIIHLAINVCLDVFQADFETGSLGVKTSSPDLIKGKPCYYSRGHIFK